MEKASERDMHEQVTEPMGKDLRIGRVVFVKHQPAMRVTWVQRLGRSPGEGNGNPLQYSCLENPMDGEAW